MNRDGLANFFLGLGIGIGLGILFAPKSGAETRDELLAKADAFALGAALRAGLAAKGTMTLVRWEPVEMVPEQVLAHLITTLDRTQAQRLVIDSLAELQRAVIETSSPGGVANSMAALLAVLRQRNVTMLGVLETEVTVTNTLGFSADPLAILAENVLLLQQMDRHSQVERVLSVLKMRYSPHATTRYTFTIDAPDGIRLGAPLEHD